jgi:hypothetical protein
LVFFFLVTVFFSQFLILTHIHTLCPHDCSIDT